MIDSLSHNRPRAALDLFLKALSDPTTTHTGRTLEGLTWIFFLYRQPLFALSAIDDMHSKGYQISSRLSSKLLRSCGNELLFDSDGLVKVLKWIQQGIEREKQEGKEIDENMIETVMDVLKKMGRNDWSEQVFGAYRGILEEGKIGSARLWAQAIAAQAAAGDVMKAQLLFRDWRNGYLEGKARAGQLEEQTSPPPEQPYLALLNHFAVNSPPLPASKDPAYLLLQLTKNDQLVPSTAFFNALLRTELYRKRFSSFWGIWNLFDNTDVISRGVVRDAASWKLATRAKLVSEHTRRQRGRIHHSPLLNLSPLAYTESHTPSSRSLFAQLLLTRSELTSNRPSLRLPTPQPDPLASSNSTTSSSATLLNSFLSLFLSTQDYPSALVVLETFHVHRIEPNPSTHSTVVLSIIRLWEKGRLTTGTRRDREEEEDLFGGTLGFEEKERKRRSRVEKNLKGPRAIEAIRNILEKRKIRVGLWRGKQTVEDEDEGGEGEVERREPSPPPDWMVQREMRDTGYLVDLLERCSGLEKEEWNRVLEETRRELLPLKKSAGNEIAVDGVEGDREGEKQKSKKSITRGARYRKERFGKEL